MLDDQQPVVAGAEPLAVCRPRTPTPYQPRFWHRVTPLGRFAGLPVMGVSG